jgi:voltage-dependent potassium channel beta subunit
MEYRFLGRSGLRVSTLSFGSWVTFGQQLDVSAARASMQAAYDAGCNLFDNAEAYANGESERVMGEVFTQTGWKRGELVVSTKLFWGGSGPNDRGLSRKHILEGLDASLGRMKLDYVDLLFCHRPDPYTPIEETVRAMSHVINQGKVLYWGTSEWSAAQILEAHAIARREHLVPPTMEQPEYHMFHRDRVEREYAPLYESVGLGTTIWSPLASGLLTGKYNDGKAPEGSRATLPGYEWLRDRLVGAAAGDRVARVRKLVPLAQELGCTLAQLAIAWCASNPRVSTVITGASRAEQVRENMKALAVVEKLEGEVMERIEAVLGNKPAPVNDWGR